MGTLAAASGRPHSGAMISTTTTSRITTPFGFNSTAAEVVAGIDLGGRRAIVTGASSGIGIETARALAGAGADLTLAVRNAEAGARTAADITATTGNRTIHVARLDLADRGSIATFVRKWSGHSTSSATTQACY